MNVFKRWLVVLLSVAFLDANAFGAHLHLCLDGKEPRASLHVLDDQDGNIQVNGADKHHDVDVNLDDQALAKAFKVNASPPAPPTSWILPAVTLADVVFTPSEEATGPTFVTYRSLPPPPRGPPA